MDVYSNCKYFYLKQIVLTIKGELPIYACKKGRDIEKDCNETCSVFQQMKKEKMLHFLGRYHYWK
jgi:hypothetical protein